MRQTTSTRIAAKEGKGGGVRGEQRRVHTGSLRAPAASSVAPTAGNVQSVEEMSEERFVSGLCHAMGMESGSSHSTGKPVTGDTFVCGHACADLFHTTSATPMGDSMGESAETVNSTTGTNIAVDSVTDVTGCCLHSAPFPLAELASRSTHV